MTTYHYNITGLHGGSYTILTGTIKRDCKPCETIMLLEALTEFMSHDNHCQLLFEPLCVSVYGGAR